MLTTILTALLPAIISLLLGFLAARHHDFDHKDAEVLNRMVLMYAVPLAIFVGTVSTPRADLAESIPLVVTIFVGIVGMYGLAFLLSRFVLGLPVNTSALAAVTASGPAVPFMGPAILGNLFGQTTSAVPIAIASLVINLTIVPFTILLLTIESSKTGLTPGREPKLDPVPSMAPVATAVLAAPRSVLTGKLLETIKKPLVWAPMLAFALVLCDFHMPQIIDHSLLLLGQASGGVAMFASGIVLAGYKIKFDWYVLLFVLLKNVAQPALVLGGLLLLGYSRPVVPEAVLTMAVPAMPIIVMLALSYHVADAYAPSILSISIIGSLFTMGAFIALTY